MRSHLAILKQPYLGLILSNRKRIECRLTRIPCPPFKQIAAGEKVLLKESCGPVRGEAVVEDVLFFENLTSAEVWRIRQEYDADILGRDEYWHSRQDCRYCTLVWLKDVRPIEPYRIKRKGLRAWVVFE